MVNPSDVSSATAPAADAANAPEAPAAAPAAPSAEAAAPPEMSELEACLAAYSAANPVDGRKLAKHIANLQRQYESTKRKASELEDHARVDKDVVRMQLQQLLKHLSPEVTKQYCIDDGNLDSQILSPKNGIAHNAVHRVIAACNATFMSAAPAASAAAPVAAAASAAAASASAAEVDSASSAKRQRTASPAPVAPAMQLGDGDDADMLRRALAAQYD
ncbi:MAG: hypothetical protein CL678_00675 [Bdellovibrionaceae bacterium]|nr:hypothetical protein [Pseudobdellovibrionaceae bacterium]